MGRAVGQDLSTFRVLGPRIVDNSVTPPPKFVDKSVVAVVVGRLSFDLPEGAEGYDAGATSNRRTGSPDRRHGDRKVVEEAGDRSRRDRTELAGPWRGRVAADRFLRALSCAPQTVRTVRVAPAAQD
jgi:hypothetical protein